MTAAPLPHRPPGTLSLATEVEVLHLVLDDLHATPLTGSPAEPTEPAALLAEVHRAQARLDALRLTLIAAADAAGVAQRSGQATTADWVANNTRSGRPESARDTALATALATSPAGTPDRPALDETRDALAHGALSAAHARVIAHALAQLPAGVTPEQRARCETRLIADAGRFDPTQLRRHARRILAEIEPDPTVVDTHENDQVTAEEDTAYARARLTFHDNGDGTTTGHFTLPHLQAHILSKLIDAMTAPRRRHPRTSATGAETSSPTASEPNPFERDRVDPAHARGLALGQLLEHLPTDHLHGTATTQVTVLIDIDTLRGHLKTAGLDTDHTISAGEARRLACTSGLTPAVYARALAGPSVILDQGRQSRLFTETQRRALTATHTHCAAGGCTRPIAWCEIHHRTPWAAGGTTDLANAIPLCGWHHRRTHDHRYRTTHHPDGTVTIQARP